MNARTGDAASRSCPAVAGMGRAVLTTSLLTPGDTATMSAIYHNVSASSRSLRFLAPVPTMPPSLLRRLAACDGYDHVVIVARVAGDPIGEGRYIRTGGGTAELAGAVVDTWAERGVGAQLLTLLSLHARNRGLDRFVFTVRTDNRAILAALRRRGAVMATTNGVTEGHLDLHGELHGAVGQHAAADDAENAARQSCRQTGL